MDVLGQELGPIVFQFPFFNRSAFRDRREFLDRLIPFLRRLPDTYKFAIEIRNRAWLDAELANLLRDHKIALVLQDRSLMPSPSELTFDPITTDWTYIRWLGDRKTIEAQTATWDRIVVDRTQELRRLGRLLLSDHETRRADLRLRQQPLWGPCAGNNRTVPGFVAE